MRRRDFLKSLGFISFGEISAKTGTKNNQIDSEISSLNKTIEFVSQQKIQKSTGKVITVLGEVLPIDLGGVLIYEHLLTKINNEYQLNDCNDAITEIKVFGDYDLKLASNQKNHTVVDVTTFGIRLPFHHQELKEISENTGINVVMGTGYYLPDWNLGIERWSVDQLANEMLNEIQIGIGPDKIRAGIIGEIGIGEYGSEASLTSNFEKKVLQASAKVQKLTGVGISLHFGTTGWTSPPENWKVRLETINFLINQGVSANRIILGHCSPLPRKPWLNDQNEASFSSNYDGMLAALKKGVYLGIDGWGTFFRIGDFNKTVESYSHFASVIFDLIEKGYENNLVFSQDIYEKGQLVKNGGCGYAHIVRDVVPYLLKAGISGTRIAKLTAYNAQRFLTIQ